jgi:hypothetical protein
MLWLFWLGFIIALSEEEHPMDDEPINVIDMKARAEEIRKEREARAKRRAQREKAQYPGGIDDMDMG